MPRTAETPTAPLFDSARKQHCKVCGDGFIPRRTTAQYCSPECRNKAYRKRQSRLKAKASKDEAPIMSPFTCEHCGQTVWQVEAKDRRYCTPSCRTGAWKTRRQAAAHTLTAISPQMTLEQAELLIEYSGMKKTANLLGDFGYSYDIPTRKWIKPTNMKV